MREVLPAVTESPSDLQSEPAAGAAEPAAREPAETRDRAAPG